MTKTFYIKILSFVVCLVGIFVIVGWIFDVGVLKSVLPGMAEMKFLTAICFVASSIVLYSTVEEHPERSFVVQMILPAANLTIFLIMGLLFFSSISGLKVGAERLFIREKAEVIQSFFPGRPSIFTMVSFLLIAIAGTLMTTRIKKWLCWVGWGIAAIGGIALAGYALNQPLLYYFKEGVSTAMAFHTALLFVLIGAAFVCYDKK